MLEEAILDPKKLTFGVHIPWVETSNFKSVSKLQEELKSGKAMVYFAIKENNFLNCQIDKLIAIKWMKLFAPILNLFRKWPEKYRLEWVDGVYQNSFLLDRGSEYCLVIRT